jgi:hypothetical protein
MWSIPEEVGDIDYRAMIMYIDSLRISDEFLSELELTLKAVHPSKIRVIMEEFAGRIEYRVEVPSTQKTQNAVAK